MKFLLFIHFCFSTKHISGYTTETFQRAVLSSIPNNNPAVQGTVVRAIMNAMAALDNATLQKIEQFGVAAKIHTIQTKDEPNPEVPVDNGGGGEPPTTENASIDDLQQTVQSDVATKINSEETNDELDPETIGEHDGDDGQAAIQNESKTDIAEVSETRVQMSNMLKTDVDEKNFRE